MNARESHLWLLELQQQSRWLLRMKSRQLRTLITNNSLQAWWLNENRLHRAIKVAPQQGTARFSWLTHWPATFS